jgi:glutathione synthase/RimK-type ligase-like ATP-grasp enzyme
MAGSLKPLRQSDQIFIVKPEAQCQGRGIFLIRDYRDLEVHIATCTPQQQNGIYDQYNFVV